MLLAGQLVNGLGHLTGEFIQLFCQLCYLCGKLSGGSYLICCGGDGCWGRLQNLICQLG